MAMVGTFPIQQLPLLPQAKAATQVQKSGTNGIADRTITTPPDFTSLVFQPGSVSVQINPSMQTPGNITDQLMNAGIAASINQSGELVLPNVTSVSGNSNLTHALGLS